MMNPLGKSAIYGQKNVCFVKNTEGVQNPQTLDCQTDSQAFFR